MTQPDLPSVHLRTLAMPGGGLSGQGRRACDRMIPMVQEVVAEAVVAA